MVQIGGLEKSTLIDYPNKIACTVFLVGCNFRCPFCYSAELVLPDKIKTHPKISLDEFFSFLEERKGLLEGVVICGGEPTVNSDLVEFIQRIKDLGFLVKLDTNGSNPNMLKELIDKGLLDYIAMDVKHNLSEKDYNKAVGVKVNLNKIKESINIIKDSKVAYEFRTTLVPNIHTKEDIINLAKYLGPAKKYCLQNFRGEKTIDPKFENIRPYNKEFLLEIKEAIENYFEICEIRE